MSKRKCNQMSMAVNLVMVQLEAELKKLKLEKGKHGFSTKQNKQYTKLQSARDALSMATNVIVK